MRTDGAGPVDGAVRQHGSMYHYHLFGGILASELEFPELPAATEATPQWQLSRSSSAPSTDALHHIGVEPVMDGVQAVLSGSTTCFRLRYDDTGTFEITDHGRTITWYPPATGVDAHNVRTDVLGRVMAVALHAAEVPTLHGSGVSLNGRGVAFLAPKLHGKSTTAAAMVRAGASLLSDDILAVVPGDRPLVLPGVPSVNLWQDSAEQLRTGAADDDGTRKRRVDWGTLGRRAAREVPLAAIYLLSPAPPGDGSRVKRNPLPPVAATLALVGQAKIGALLGGTAAPVLMRQLSRVTATVPVYRLSVPRELDRIDELVSCMSRWHDGALRLPATAAREGP